MTAPALHHKISVIIVSYNTREHTCDAIQALQNEPIHQIIVVDNASQDGTPQEIERRFPSITLIKNTRNRGFGSANNQGLDAMTGDIALLLNSDCLPKTGAIAALAQSLQDPSVIAAGGKLLHPDGTHQQSACNKLTLWAVFCEQFLLEKLFPNSKLFSPYWVSHRFTQPNSVEQVMGACLMMRPVERFEERFFLYCEDTELCYRLRRHGQILYVPQAEFTHALGASSTGNRWWSVAMYNRGKELYFRIHHGTSHQVVCLFINRLGALLRLMIKPWQTAMWIKVLFAPVNGPKKPSDA